MTQPRRFPPPWTIEELDPITANQPMTAEQAATLKRLAEAAYELEAFKPNLTRAEADAPLSQLQHLRHCSPCEGVGTQPKLEPPELVVTLAVVGLPPAPVSS